MAIEDQKPVGSGFSARPDGTEVIRDVELEGKTAIVTGGCSGIGLETVRALAAKGVKVLVPARSEQKAAENLAGLAGRIEIGSMDLGDIGSVRAFVDHAGRQLETLDLLISNAGIMATPETRIGKGWEAQFTTNHLGHMALTQALWPLLEKTPGARVVALSSTGHKVSDIRWDDVHFEASPYHKWQAYGQSKTANALFANALSRRLARSGGLAFAVHPGGIFTPLQRHLSLEEQVQLGWLTEDGQPTELPSRASRHPNRAARPRCGPQPAPCSTGSRVSTAKTVTSQLRPIPKAPWLGSWASTRTPAATKPPRGSGP